MSSRIKSCTLYYDAVLTDPHYLRCKINGKNPYDEKVMSMPQLHTLLPHSYISEHVCLPYKTGVYFFFIYNLENYYHFLYDTLPYLNFYFSLSPRPTLLVEKDHKFLKFQKEMLLLLGILEKDIEYATDATYEHLYVPTSLTHGQLINGANASNYPPDALAYKVWGKLNESVYYSLPTPKKFYVSRRSYIHGDSSNIGTNYTTRRRCINENAVVELVKSYGYEEVFCEIMSTEQKIATFKNATHIIGFIGGGMANTLFSPGSVKVGTILTPEFNKINTRFVHCMNHCKLSMLDITDLAPYTGIFPLFTRVQIKDKCSALFDKIGEVHACEDGKYSVHVSPNVIAGFSLDASLIVSEFYESQLMPLDGGLNSPFVCNITALKNYLDAESKDV